MISCPCTFDTFVTDYAKNQSDDHPMAVQLTDALAQSHPNADATKFLLKQATTKHGRLLMDTTPTKLSEFCSAAIKMVRQYQPDIDDLPHDKNSYKTELLAIMSDGGMQENVHFTVPPGASKLTGRGVILTSLGKHVALTQGLGLAWQPLNVAYTTIANPNNNFYRVLLQKYSQYVVTWKVERGESVRAFQDQKEAIVPMIDLADVAGETPEDKMKKAQKIAQAHVMRHDKTLYKSFYVPDDTPGGMTGQAARANGYLPKTVGLNGWDAGIKKMRKQSTIAAKLTKYKQYKLAASRADVEDFMARHPNISPARAAAIVTQRAMDLGTNLSYEFVDDQFQVLPPDVQRTALFGHASHLPPVAQLLAPPDAVPAP